MFTGWKLGVLIVGAILFALYVKSWQCAEMFPNANRLACMLWNSN